jgi:hypothetical protein
MLLSEQPAGLVIPIHSILAEVRVSQLTVYLARFIGLFAVLVVAGFLVRGSTVVEKTVADGSVMVVYAVISLASGLAMILGHNVWSGGTLPVVVTLVGWLILAKGLLLFFVTPEALTRFLERMQYGEHYSLYIAPSLIIRLYLIWAGFTAPPTNASQKETSRRSGGTRYMVRPCVAEVF